MRPFRRSRGRFVAAFVEPEVLLLTSLLDQLRELLAGRRAEAPTDDLVALTGITVAPPSPPADPALQRLFPDFVVDDGDTAAALRTLHEPEILAAKDRAVVDVLDMLPAGGGTVHLTREQTGAWLTALNDLRLVIGVRLGVTEDDEVPPAVAADPQGPAAASFDVYRWLTVAQDSLVVALLD